MNKRQEQWIVDDLDAILDFAIKSGNLLGVYTGANRTAIENAIVGSPGAEVRTLMTLAWKAGYERAERR